MARASMTVLPDWGATFSGYQAKSDVEITYYTRRFPPDQLRELAVNAARFSQAVFSLKRRLDCRELLPLMDTTIGPV